MYVHMWILGDRRAEIRIRKLIAKKGICRDVQYYIDLFLYPLLHVLYTTFKLSLDHDCVGEGCGLN